MDWFSVMATTEEKAQLESAAGRVLPPEGERRRIAESLDSLIQDRFVRAYKDEGLDVPKNLKTNQGKKRKLLTVIGIGDRMGARKKAARTAAKDNKNPRKNEGVKDILPRTFQDWRSGGDQQQGDQQQGDQPQLRRSPQRHLGSNALALPTYLPTYLLYLLYLPTYLTNPRVGEATSAGAPPIFLGLWPHLFLSLSAYSFFIWG